MTKIVCPKFDRKGQVKKSGKGTLEIYICLSRSVRKYISYTKCAPTEVDEITKSPEFQQAMAYYQHAISLMEKKGLEMTMENFNNQIGVKTIVITRKEEKKVTYKTFTDFIRDAIAEEKISEETKKHKYTTLDSLVEFNKLTKWEQLNEDGLRAYDKWLRDNGNRSDVTIYNYHKHLKKWCRLAYEARLIEESPYKRVHFSRGKSKEREPLNEAELVRMRKLKLTGHLERARDLFIFAAYTGLAYCDVMNFNYDNMTKKIGKQIYIDGSRIKTGSDFFTPILSHAMAILKKYNYNLPVMSNQKLNDYIRVVATMAKIHTKVSFHVARHSFATLCLTYEVPIENVARMLGHKDIKVTQIYAKTLDATIHRQTQKLASSIR